MERLTMTSNKGGLAFAFDLDITCNPSEARKIQKLGEKLKAYEDTGLSPADIADLHNELCLRCGKYKTAHEGSCDGCRWKEKTK